MALKHGLISVFQMVFLACFLFIILTAFGYSFLVADPSGFWKVALSLFVFALLVLVVFLRFYQLIGRFSDLGQKRAAWALLFLTGCVETVIVCAAGSIVPPLIDGGHTYVEARYLLLHGHASHSIYFKVYPNNIPVTLLRYVLYRIATLCHFNDFLLLDRLFCAAVLFAAFFIGWRLVRQLFDERSGSLFLLMMLTTLPFFLYIPYFYTDTTIILIPILLVYLLFRHQQSGRQRYIVWLGLALAAGYLIRPNLILFLPALLIYLFFVERFRRVLTHTAIIGVLLIACIGAEQYGERQLGYYPDPAYAMPTIHWVMLGVSSVGEYTKGDFERTLHEPTQAAKKQTDWQTIERRMRADGFSGLIKLWAIKTARTWGVGAHAYYWYSEYSNPPSAPHAYIFGDRRQLIVFVTQVFYIVSLFLMLFSSLRYFRTKEITINLLLHICLFGNFLFYTFIWEAEPRYSLLFSPFIVLSAVFGFRECVHYFRQMNGFVSGRLPRGRRMGFSGKRIELAVMLALAVAVPVCGLANQKAFTSDRKIYADFRVNILHGQGKDVAVISRQQKISQTFYAGGPFNRIGLKLNRITGKASYRLTLEDEKTGKILYMRRFQPHDPERRSSNMFEVLKITEQRPTHEQAYRLTFTFIKGNADAHVAYKVNGLGFDQRDIYPPGRLFINGQMQPKKDLVFQIFEKKSHPYMPPPLYWLPLAIVEMLIMVDVVRLIKKRTGWLTAFKSRRGDCSVADADSTSTADEHLQKR
ncbi:MAG: glycosyltransferase family 39 protein [Sporolactobacillus sp.]